MKVNDINKSNNIGKRMKLSHYFFSIHRYFSPIRRFKHS